MPHIVYWIFGKTSASRGSEYPDLAREYVGVTSKTQEERVEEHARASSGAAWLKFVTRSACETSRRDWSIAVPSCGC